MNQFYFPLDWEGRTGSEYASKAEAQKKSIHLLATQRRDCRRNPFQHQKCPCVYVLYRRQDECSRPCAPCVSSFSAVRRHSGGTLACFAVRFTTAGRERRLFVCGNRISGGMKGEIQRAAELKMPITVFDRDTYIEVRRLVTQCGADKKLVAFSECHDTLAASSPVTERGR